MIAQRIAIGVLRFFAWLYLVITLGVAALLFFGLLFGSRFGTSFSGLPGVSGAQGAGILGLVAVIPALAFAAGGLFVWAILIVLAAAAEDLMYLRYGGPTPQ